MSLACSPIFLFLIFQSLSGELCQCNHGVQYIRELFFSFENMLSKILLPILAYFYLSGTPSRLLMHVFLINMLDHCLPENMQILWYCQLVHGKT